jgi:hypothetical protein
MPLHEVMDWVDGTACVPTALAAISGLPIPAIMETINAEAGGNVFDQFDDIPPRWWLRALRRLGLRCEVDRGHRGLTIDELMERAFAPDPILVFASDDQLNRTHVFAVHGNYFVDWYTRGRIAEFARTPDDMRSFRVRGSHSFYRPQTRREAAAKRRKPRPGRPGLNGRKAGHGGVGDAFHPNSC